MINYNVVEAYKSGTDLCLNLIVEERETNRILDSLALQGNSRHNIVIVRLKYILVDFFLKNDGALTLR